MKNFRFCLMCIMCIFSQWSHAYTLDITEHIWEIAFLNEETLYIPYYDMGRIVYSNKDLNNIEHDELVSQKVESRSNSCTQNIADIVSMRYQKEDRKILSETTTEINPKGIDWDLHLPEGATVTTRSHFLEKIMDNGTIKIYARRNYTVFWRRDTIDILLPDDPEPVSFYLEQPGDDYYKVVEARAGLSVDCVNEVYDESGSWTSYSYGTGIGSSTGGTTECEYKGKVGDKVHTYVVKHKRGSREDNDDTFHLEVIIDVSQKPGKVLQFSITDNSSYTDPHEAIITKNFSVTFGETEGNSGGDSMSSHYTVQDPTSWSYEETVRGNGYGRTTYIRDNKILGVDFFIQFYK